MYTIQTSGHFDAAHFLAGYQGKCRNIHGHRWNIEIVVGCEELIEEGNDRGMVIDFGDLKAALESITDSLDHALIYEKGSLKETTIIALKEEEFRLVEVDFRPTAECFAKYFYDKMKDIGYNVISAEVFETPTNAAKYTER